MKNEQSATGKFCLQAGLFCGVCVFAVYAFLYGLQDKLIYMPGMPIRFIEENPRGYRSPEERAINYSPISLETADDELIKGWFMAERDPR